MSDQPKLNVIKVIGFTGTQDGMTKEQRTRVKQMVDRMKPKDAHHGDCIGADEQFHNIAQGGMMSNVIIHPPNNPSKRAYCSWAYQIRAEKPYLERNKDIVNECDYLIAAPKEKEEQQRSGTWSTIRYARKVKRNHTIVFHDGTMQSVNYEIQGLLK